MPSTQVAHPALSFKPTRVEAGKIARLMRRLDVLSNEYDLSRPYKEYLEYLSKRKPITAELNALAADIGQRTLGELPLTLRSDEADASPVAVLSLEITSSWDKQYAWIGKGFKLKKDGSVGLKEGRIRLNNKRMWRRQLDDSWTPLVGQSEKLTRAIKC